MYIGRLPTRISGKDCEHEEWVTAIDFAAAIQGGEEPSGSQQRDSALDRPTENQGITAHVGVTTADQMRDALRAAKLAQPQWEKMGLKARRDIIEAVRQKIIAELDTFTDLLCREGHPRSLAEWELNGALEMTCPTSVDTAAHFMEYNTTVNGRTITVRRRGDGVVAFHPPKNAPASSSLLGLLVLLGGNAVVMKAPRSCPAAVAWLWSVIVEPTLREHGAPEGLVAVTCGDPEKMLELWVNSPDCDDIFYIGGSRHGSEWEKRAVASGKKPILELEGNDHLLVTDSADLPGATRAANECFYGSAQICMVPKNVWVEESVAPEFITQLKTLAEGLSPGSPEREGNRLSPVIRIDSLFTFLSEATAAGAEILTGGYRVNHRNEPDESGEYVRPTVVTIPNMETALKLRCVREETFFPLLPVITFSKDEFSTILNVINEAPHGLRASLWSNDPGEIKEFSDTVANCGILKINDSHTGMTEGMPTHGGTGITGGAFGELNMPMIRTTHAQAVVDATGLGNDDRFPEPRFRAHSAGPVPTGDKQR